MPLSVGEIYRDECHGTYRSIMQHHIARPGYTILNTGKQAIFFPAIIKSKISTVFLQVQLTFRLKEGPSQFHQAYVQ